MPTRARYLLLPAAGFLLAGCGYIGDPLPPSLAVPSQITDLHALERGDKLIVDFTAPGLALDGAPLRRLREVELRVGPEGGNWAAEARRVETGAEEAGPVHLEVSGAPWVGQDVLIGVRAISRKGRAGEWSNSVRLRIVPPLETPAGVKAEGTADGVRVTWSAPPRPGLTWRVFRRTPEQEHPDLAGTAAKPEFADATAQYGKKYQYSVQAAMNAGDAEAESARSSETAIALEDVFPPATPSGVSALAGLGSIQLTWNPNTEADLKGYFLYRSAGDQPYARLGDLLDSPTYTDRAVEAGQRYRYAASAIDQKGNESARSAPVEVAAP